MENGGIYERRPDEYEAAALVARLRGFLGAVLWSETLAPIRKPTQSGRSCPNCARFEGKIEARVLAANRRSVTLAGMPKGKAKLPKHAPLGNREVCLLFQGLG